MSARKCASNNMDSRRKYCRSPANERDFVDSRHYSSKEHVQDPRSDIPLPPVKQRRKTQAPEEGPRSGRRHETRPSIPPRRASAVSSSCLFPRIFYNFLLKSLSTKALNCLCCKTCTKHMEKIHLVQSVKIVPNRPVGRKGLWGWARADGELRAGPPRGRIGGNRGAGRLARRGVRHETRDASGDMRPRDVRQVAAFSPLTSHVSRPAHHLGQPDRAAGQARKARRAGPEPSRQESRMPSIPRSSGARSSPSRWSWWSRWSRAAT